MIRDFEGHRPQLDEGAWVDPQALVLGQVRLAADVSIWPMAVVRGDVNRITIGARSNIQDNSTLHVTHDGPYTPGGVPLVIGEDVTVGHGVTLHACTTGDRCLIGMGALVLDQAVLEDEVFLAAGSLVPPGKRLASGWLYRGSPAQPVRAISETERESLRYSAEHYVRLKRRHSEG
ncbi:gamma carbonic anhydrase family protein [Algiphilus sp. NNCM1]|uniref:gamma carbonic anhydrase family protein n=1 Tax=Algiphilus sp. TaxID=1872431 RepID=UPI001CA65D75|nr:gamma carbonic anhydrase family protein [Algiphilus sp.]MBY8965562.1 gamma carbonic anhydrase family protein [Algiphilus acroporae]MCI5064072.1 gamma carbonic anhydrase family protein [Algiphilus sp.]MCI5104060.1 gamma carbonic anhydrase family protein [Algiphilus sp.]